MGAIASMRAAIHDPVWMRKVNGWLTVFWLWNFPPVITLYVVLGDTVFTRFCLLYLALVSIWANVAGHWSGWISGRVEVKQQADADVSEVLAEIKKLREELA